MRERLDEKERKFVVHVRLPDEKEIEKMVLQKKKADLLNRYVSDVLMEEQTEAKDFLNIHR
jgi:pre-mRNA-splicing factor ISY1